ncbi:glycoside hydrolase family 36 N-terminal domain-containing protein [Micromonospora sp. BRA006-A]|nr:glycoside hydrolase family 36 N-terminal domain-containing protein [Micromonospora sp. BRA006-A]
MLPVPAVATELLDLTGRWCRERAPQRHPWPMGAWVREGRHGRTGHDATLLLVAGTSGFGFRHGEVWAVHTAWSGDHVTAAERRPTGESTLGGGELLAPGEIVLGRARSTPLPCSTRPTRPTGWTGSATRCTRTYGHAPRTRARRGRSR